MRRSRKFFGEEKWAQQALGVAANFGKTCGKTSGKTASGRIAIGRIALVTALLVLASVLAAPALVGGNAAAQNKKNDNKEADTTSLIPPGSLPDPQAIDLVVGQMLGAWQVGEVEMMRKFYADDVVVVSGAWEQPLIGWESYARAYQAQFARTNGGRLDRTNTYTKVLGEDAWVTYQWQYSGQVDGTPFSAVGHTTLVLQKRAGIWVIVLNHTSQVPTPTATAGASPQPASTPLASSERR
jgi:ketosteroid isomerase-like protein